MTIALLVLLLSTAAAAPQNVSSIRIDASSPWLPPGPAAYDEGAAQSPSGETIGLNSRYLTRDGKPWLPIMGEFQFSRYPESQWEEELLKMKAAGVNVVASYVIWIHHEEIKGQFDWSGQRNLRHFAKLCARHGMLLVLRVGPWDHAEVRNGGLPDWVLQQGPTRVNDPAYLASVRVWYQQIGLEVNGLLWKDGGPIIGIQLENEYAKRGPNAGKAHILELKKLAMDSNLNVPLYLVTGWDDAVVPARAVLPVYGGYPAAPWSGSTDRLPPSEVYLFRFGSRVGGDMGMIGKHSAESEESTSYDALPFLTAEIGGGIQDTYHRRPVIQADDVAAMFPVMLGSGVNLYGTYMFQGGENPRGKLSTLQESQATGGANDLPVESYDFQAPLGEFGQERESFRKLKVFQYFVNSFGDQLAPMVVHSPARLPNGTADFTVPRASVRSNGDQGFLFFNNYVRGYSMPVRHRTQFVIALPNESLTIPRHPIDIPSGAYFIWPFNLIVNGVAIRYSTAQLFTRIDDPDQTTLYFVETSGIPPEFAFDAATTKVVGTSSGVCHTESGVTYATGIVPSLSSSIELRSRNDKHVRIVLLTVHEAEDAWKVRIDGVDHLLFTRQDFFADYDRDSVTFQFRSRGSSAFNFAISPPVSTPFQADSILKRIVKTPNEIRFTAVAEPRDPKLRIRPIQPAGVAPPVSSGQTPRWDQRHVAEAPADEAFRAAAKWSIVVPQGALKGLSNLFLDVNYQGDVARLESAHCLLVDDFYNGVPWQIGLRRYLEPKHSNAFELQILPLRADAPIFLEPAVRARLPTNGQIESLQSIRLIPEYELSVTLKTR